VPDVIIPFKNLTPLVLLPAVNTRTAVQQMARYSTKSSLPFAVELGLAGT
jgi:hypothetical protein